VWKRCDSRVLRIPHGGSGAERGGFGFELKVSRRSLRSWGSHNQDCVASAAPRWLTKLPDFRPWFWTLSGTLPVPKLMFSIPS
jgi:hypothetical protein